MERTKRGLVERLSRRCRYYLLRLIRVRDEQKRVQKGVALGAVMHFIPTPGIGLAFALVVAVFLRANKAATTIANLFAAPAALPMWFLNYWVGSWFVGDTNVSQIQHLEGHGLGVWRFLASQGVGFFIGIAVNMVVWFAVLYYLSGWILRWASTRLHNRRNRPTVVP
ncbi:MAG: DUF2062 domain-containing protein [Alicyclobacillaceae bacterium]|nr:DUF2062 domain-containing protein [Alicyclobacillaceae bacterium]MDI3329090.1 DUF2062 domain-containing protein [Alicyclobacillaceae bacterium]